MSAIERERKQPSGAYFVIYIILALELKAALEAIFVPAIQKENWAILSPLQWAQGAIFFLMTLRFYLGATRFVNTEPQHLTFLTRATNVVFAFMLFCAFYATALAVVVPSSFYLLMVIVHVIDAAWFATAILCLWHMPDTDLGAGDLKKSAAIRIMVTFFILSFVTVAFAGISYGFLFHDTLTNGNATPAHWSFLGVLAILSMLDFALLHEYYFDFEQWRSNNSLSA